MSEQKKLGFATRQIHAGRIENAAGALCAPIYQTSTFAFSSVEQGGALSLIHISEPTRPY